MASKNRRKGDYHERKIVWWLQEQGFQAKRQPMSGQLGGEYSGDIIWKLGGYGLVTEVKYRDSSSFPNAFKVLEGRDAAIFKRKTGSPRTCVIFDGDIFEKYIAPILKENLNVILTDGESNQGDNT